MIARFIGGHSTNPNEPRNRCCFPRWLNSSPLVILIHAGVQGSNKPYLVYGVYGPIANIVRMLCDCDTPVLSNVVLCCPYTFDMSLCVQYSAGVFGITQNEIQQNSRDLTQILMSFVL